MASHLLAFWGSNVATARRRKGWTQGQLAKAAGSTQQWVSVIERGAVEPRHATKMALADALDVDADDLFPSQVEQASA